MTIAVFLGALLGAMALGMPIAFALLVCGAALMYHMDMMDAQIIAQNLINGADSFPLMAVPFFMLAGEIMNTGGLSKRIVNVAMAMVGHVRGGLGYVAILASCLLAALSGSAVADAAALSALLVPMMVGAGHDRARSCGLIAAGGIIGPIIPPSIGFIIFGVAANLSISKLFLAGIFPGLLIGLSLVCAWWWAARNENLTPPPRKTTAEVLKTLADGFWALMLPLIIIFGLKFGIFTPTEAAVVCAVYSLFVAVFIYKELKPAQIYGVFVSAARTTAIVMFLVAAALVSAWLITVADLPGQIVGLLEPFMGNKILLMFAMMAVVVIVGTAMDMTPDHPDPHPGADAHRDEGRHRSDLLRRAVHHQQRHRPDYPAGRHGAQRGGRGWQDQHGRPDEGRVALHGGRTDHVVADDPVPRAGDCAGQLVQLICPVAVRAPLRGCPVLNAFHYKTGDKP